MIKNITVGMNSCGLAAGAQEVYDRIKKELKNNDLKINLKKVGCVGMCYREPLVDVISDKYIYTYGNVTPDKVSLIIKKHIIEGNTIENFVVKKENSQNLEMLSDRDGYFSKQMKIVLENSGYIDPESIDEYIAAKGYESLKKALLMKPEEIIDFIYKSGLRGRGGAGFSTGLKWKFAREAKGDTKYLICNADEGDPGAFMDRNILEGDPHRVLEGMIIAAYAIGAKEAFIYARAEYPLAIKRLIIAIKECKEKSFLGDNILGSNFSLEIKIKKGAGAFVCGEETALMASIEGKRGMPRPRPPFPAQKGLWNKPTNINNVETYANVPWIIRNGWEKYAEIGTEKSKGTKVFALAGKVKHGGNVEVPMGLTINEILKDIAGGSISGKKIKAVQLGGPSGGCIPENLFDTPIDYDSINATGAIMGSGGIVIMDDDTCMVDISKFFLDFTVKESCGKCTYCRIGMKRMYEIVDRITQGKGVKNDIKILEELSPKIIKGSLCGLGQTAPNPVLTTIRYFKEEYDSHINDKKCPAKVCKPLITYMIKAEKCTGCTLCAIKCPAEAIEGEKKKVHTIIQNKCIKCGACYEACKFDAIEVR